jgi:Domain of unknown function (DUF4286)
MSLRVMYVVHVRLPVEAEKEWNDWHNKEHIPLVLAQPGFMSARKFRTISNDRKQAEYFVLYELRNQAAYEKYVKSEDANLLRQQYLDKYGPQTKITRYAWMETFQILK